MVQVHVLLTRVGVRLPSAALKMASREGRKQGGSQQGALVCNLFWPTLPDLFKLTTFDKELKKPWIGF